jgi:hypothetical protein
MPNIGEKKNLNGRKLKKPNKIQKTHRAGFFYKKPRGFANPV